MTYTAINKAHTKHDSRNADGKQIQRYSRHETGVIAGKNRELMAVIADTAGFDGLGFDASVGSGDDSWHVLNAYKENGHYVDAIVVGGAMDAGHAMQVARMQLDHLGATYCVAVTDQSKQFDSATATGDEGTFSIDAISKLLSNPSQNQGFLPVITAPELVEEAERVTFDAVEWGDSSTGFDSLISHGGKDSHLLLDMTRADSRNELIDTFDLSEALASMGASEPSFDALM
jgi:hypothetical protein